MGETFPLRSTGHIQDYWGCSPMGNKTARKTVAAGNKKPRRLKAAQDRGESLGSSDVTELDTYRTAKQAKHAPRDAERHAARREIKPKNPEQTLLLTLMDSKTITVATGPAGTGKTFCAMSRLCQKLLDGEIQTIVLTRPIVEAGEKLGFLPGDIMEKVTPYLAPYYKALLNFFGTMSVIESQVKAGKIVVKPLAYMRGDTFDGCGIILDEAQNTTVSQMKMFLTRTGRHSCVVVDGDPDQTDIRGPNGLSDLLRRLDYMPNVGHVELTQIVRDDIVAEVLKAYAVKLDA